MLIAEMKKIEAAARNSMGNYHPDPVPSDRAAGPYTYVRLGILFFAVLIGALWLFEGI